MQFPAAPPRYRGYMLRFWQERSQRGTQAIAPIAQPYAASGLLRDAVALVHIEWQLTFGQGDATRQGRAINTMIMANEGGAWSIVAVQNTLIAV